MPLDRPRSRGIGVVTNHATLKARLSHSQGDCGQKPMTKAINPPSAADPLITQPTHYTSLTPRQLKSAQAAGLLPEPIKLGIKLRAWRKSALDALLTGQATPTTAQTV